jgi:dihydrofolate reductase/thymidylate synthase
MANSLSIVVASDETGGIGKDGMLPWRLPEDMHHFKILTTTAPVGKVNAVIMGRRTWKSLPIHPLPHRVNIVVSTTMQNSRDDVLVCKDLDNALETIKIIDNLYKVFIIGGSRLYTEALLRPECRHVYLTHVRGQFDCDVFFPINALKTLYCLVNEGNLKNWKNGQDEILYNFEEYLRDGKIE